MGSPLRTSNWGLFESLHSGGDRSSGGVSTRLKPSHSVADTLKCNALCVSCQAKNSPSHFQPFRNFLGLAQDNKLFGTSRQAQWI